jgi:hypothetical protein
MSVDDKDPFIYRSQGGRIEVGSEEGDNMSAFVKVDDQLLCITRKNTRTVLMADHVDPDRTNPDIQHNVQHVLPYGSDSKFVGKTLQQANILFEEHSLPKTIDHNKGMRIAFSFLKEVTALEKTKIEYVNEETEINSNLAKSSHVPSLPNLEQKIKNFISNADHACGLMMETAHLFYPNVKGKGWELKLVEELKSPEQDDFIDFVKGFQGFTLGIRRMRNKIEHPYGDFKNDDFLIQNYKLTPKNVVVLPSICYKSIDFNYPETHVSVFMNSTVHNSLTIFELLMAYLCNLHAEPFAGDKRVVVSVPEDKREESAKHVGFEYQILWRK